MAGRAQATLRHAPRDVSAHSIIERADAAQLTHGDRYTHGTAKADAVHAVTMQVGISHSQHGKARRGTGVCERGKGGPRSLRPVPDDDGWSCTGDAAPCAARRVGAQHH